MAPVAGPGADASRYPTGHPPQLNRPLRPAFGWAHDPQPKPPHPSHTVSPYPWHPASPQEVQPESQVAQFSGQSAQLPRGQPDRQRPCEPQQPDRPTARMAAKDTKSVRFISSDSFPRELGSPHQDIGLHNRESPENRQNPPLPQYPLKPNRTGVFGGLCKIEKMGRYCVSFPKSAGYRGCWTMPDRVGTVYA
jgi:hypothetical protein